MLSFGLDFWTWFKALGLMDLDEGLVDLCVSLDVFMVGFEPKPDYRVILVVHMHYYTITITHKGPDCTCGLT